jgi:hypothetical protein
LTNPPKALLKARLDNIAIVPASLLGLKALWQTTANTLPQGGVLLCHSPQNSRWREIKYQYIGALGSVAASKNGRPKRLLWEF